jgi:hypothetical protein
MKTRVKRDGSVELTLEPTEAEALRDIPALLQAVYDAPAEDPARARLFPRAYLDPTEEQSEQEWEALTYPGLQHDRMDQHDRVLAALDRATVGRRVVVTLAGEDLEACVMVLNEARLALGARLGVTEDTDLRRIAADDPRVPTFAVYQWLGHLQADLVEALLGGLPD